VPGWVTLDYLSEAWQRVSEREHELTAGIERALEQPAPQPNGANAANIGSAVAPGENHAEQDATLAANLRHAVPLLEAAGDASERASVHLGNQALELAFSEQTSGYESLLAARELFLDIRRLIGLIYQVQKKLLGGLEPPGSGSGSGSDATAAPAPPVGLLATIQKKNIARMARLGTLVSDELANLAAALGAKGGGGQSAPGSTSKLEPQRLESAYEHWRLANRAMYRVREFLSGFETRDRKPEIPVQARDAARTAIVHLEDLRRLFFNVLEHLKETAVQQQALGDATQSLATLGGPAPSTTKTGPIAARQKQLAETASAIAQALEEQASSSSSPPPPNAASSPRASPPAAPLIAPPAAAQAAPQASGPTKAQSERFEQASGLVRQAGKRMERAAERIESKEADFPESRAHQTSALENLTQAITLLEPPPEPDGSQEQQEQDGQDSADQTGNADNRQPAPSPANNPSMRELLQEVRDREAQRRRTQAQRPHAYEPVEKNW